MRKRVKRQVWALINPLVHALEGATIAPRDKLDKLRLTEYSALDSITKDYAEAYRMARRFPFTDIRDLLPPPPPYRPFYVPGSDALI